ncbi:NUDIX domain-containing protein [Georgenia wutianyii]|uniref:NUDIX domain-containing protein n=1 Tax=Georgenia wutianyii TaxID=2585135 RepID=A0ABX5VNL1_9MICO|nr:NUDIX domain-containing protein [Georgenia wutianyii]
MGPAYERARRGREPCPPGVRRLTGHRATVCEAGPVPEPTPARPSGHTGDGWVECRCGARHWGRYGAAGLLLWRRLPAQDGGEPAGSHEVVLQHRATWSHHGGTWGVPGGAIDPGETDVAAALREACEEAGILPADVRVRASHRLDHGDWTYTTVVAEASADLTPRVSDPESLAVAWVEEEAVRERPLLPAFADALPALSGLLGRRLVLVVDGANTMGARPDGWWRDRAAATVRLRDGLAALARDGLPADGLGLPGHAWYPDVVLVAEGRARGVPGLPGGGGLGALTVVDAPGEGDETILAEAQRHVRQGADVVVVTSDRELRRRVEVAGARTVGPRLVLR